MEKILLLSKTLAKNTNKKPKPKYYADSISTKKLACWLSFLLKQLSFFSFFLLKKYCLGGAKTSRHL